MKEDNNCIELRVNAERMVHDRIREVLNSV